MKVENQTIVITDPCYILKETLPEYVEDWEKANYGANLENLGINHYINEETLYGDWGCNTFKINKLNPMDILTKGPFKKELQQITDIGEFCADSGKVAVFILEEVLQYNENFLKWAKEHPWCVTIIENYTGNIQYITIPTHEEWFPEEAHIIGEGKKFNFITKQTSF